MKMGKYKYWLTALAVVFSLIFYNSASVSSIELRGASVAFGEVREGDASVWESSDGKKLVVSQSTATSLDKPLITMEGAERAGKRTLWVEFDNPEYAIRGFEVLQNVTRNEYEESCEESRTLSENGTAIIERTCSPILVSSTTTEEWVAHHVQAITVEQGQAVRILHPFLIGNAQLKYTVKESATDGTDTFGVDPILQGVEYTNSSNLSIKLNFPDDMTPPPWMPIDSIEINGIPEKNANSTDLRLVETSTGNFVCFDVISTTPTSAEIIPLVNFSTSSENKTFVLYWGNSSVTDYDNSCPNDMNYQNSILAVPEADVSFGFAYSTLKYINKSNSYNMGTATYFTYEGITQAFGDGFGSHSLNYDGNNVKEIKVLYGVRSAIFRMYAFNNYTKYFDFQGFQNSASDGFYGRSDDYSADSGANTVYFRDSNGRMGSISGGSNYESQAYGLLAASPDSKPWVNYLWVNVSQQQLYTDGTVTHSYTRSGDGADPQYRIPTTSWGTSFKWVMKNMTPFYLGTTRGLESAFNYTYATHNATWKVAYSSVVDSAGELANESQADSAIEEGIDSAISATKYSTQQAYVVNASGYQTLSTYDWIAASGNKRWLISYVTTEETFSNAANLTPSVYVLEMANMTETDIVGEVSRFINETS